MSVAPNTQPDEGADHGGSVRIAPFPPYPPYVVEPAPPSVADAIVAGHDLRLQHKTAPKTLVQPPPKPARPGGVVTDVKMSRKRMRAHVVCLRKHNVVLSDRLEHMARPQKRTIIQLWRDHGSHLPAETIARLRCMLDADEPFRPDQAYEYFINQRKTIRQKKQVKAKGVQTHKITDPKCTPEKRLLWNRNATVIMARGIYQKLSRPGSVNLKDGMLRLSNIVLGEICNNMYIRKPSRSSRNPKSKMLMDVSDRVAIMINDVITEAEDRMLMMDFDEDDDIIKFDRGDDFSSSERGGKWIIICCTADYTNAQTIKHCIEVNTLGKPIPKIENYLINYFAFKCLSSFITQNKLLNTTVSGTPAYLTAFTAEQQLAFKHLTGSMKQKSQEVLLKHGKFEQSYKAAANELMKTTNFDVVNPNQDLVYQIQKDLHATASEKASPEIKPHLPIVIETCAKYLGQNAEYNKDKGPAFRALVKSMKGRGDEVLYDVESRRSTYSEAAYQLEIAKGLEGHVDNKNLANDIHGKLGNLVNSSQMQGAAKKDMEETLEKSSNYLAYYATNAGLKLEGPEFDLLIKTLESQGSESFTPQYKPLDTKGVAARVLKNNTDFQVSDADPKVAKIFYDKLHETVNEKTPPELKDKMNDTINICSDFLSSAIKDKAKLNALIQGRSAGGAEGAGGPGGVGGAGESASRGKGGLGMDGFVDRGPAFALLIKILEEKPKDTFAPETSPFLDTRENGAYILKTAPVPLKVSNPDPKTAGVFSKKLHEIVDASTPANLKDEMKGIIEDSSGYLSVAIKDEARLKKLLEDRDKLRGTAGSTKPRGALGMDGYVDRGPAFALLINTLEAKPKDTFAPETSPFLDTRENGAYILKNAPVPLKVSNPDPKTAGIFSKKLHEIVDASTPANLKDEMKGIIEDSSGYLSVAIKDEAKLRKLFEDRDKLLGGAAGSQGAMQGGKGTGKDGFADRGPAFAHLIKTLEEKPNDKFAPETSPFLDTRENGAYILKTAPVPLKVSNPDPATAGVFSKKLHEIVDASTPANLKDEMKGIIEDSSGYLSVAIKDEEMLKKLLANKAKSGRGGAGGKDTRAHRGPNFDFIIATLESKGSEAFTPEYPPLDTNENAAYILKCAPDLKVTDPDPKAAKVFSAKLHAAVDAVTPPENKEKINGLIEDCSKYLSSAIKDEAKLRALLANKLIGGVGPSEMERERQEAMKLLQTKLASRGGEVLHSLAPSSITYVESSKLVGQDGIQSVKGGAETKRVAIVVERKINELVKKDTPQALQDAMQDAVIEASQRISEHIVSKNYRIQARDVLIAELQKGGDQLLVEYNDVEETAFCAAQRLKMAKSLAIPNPDEKKASCIGRRIEYLIRCRPVPRKLLGVMKEQIREASDYLSKCVTIPDPYIQCYITLLRTLDSAGDKILVDGPIRKTCKQSADYLKGLISFDDKINKPNSSTESRIQSEMTNLISKLPSDSYDNKVMPGVIKDCAKLLSSYVTLQGLKTEALKSLVEILKKEDFSKILLRHGNVCKTYMDAATVLQGKTFDEISAAGADAVAVRKIELKLEALLADKPKIQYMDGILEEVTTYLAFQLLQPLTRHICKCRRDNLVQCELWCDQVLRKVSKPCTCCNDETTRLCPSRIRTDLDAYIKPCPTLENKSCPARRPTCIPHILYITESPVYPTLSSQYQTYSPSDKFSDSVSVNERVESSTSSDISGFVYDNAKVTRTAYIKTRPHSCYDKKSDNISDTDIETSYKTRRPNICIEKLNTRRTSDFATSPKYYMNVTDTADAHCGSDYSYIPHKLIQTRKTSEASFHSSKLSRSRSSDNSNYTTASDEFHFPNTRRTRSSDSSYSRSPFRECYDSRYTKVSSYSRGTSIVNEKYDAITTGIKNEILRLSNDKYYTKASKLTMTCDTSENETSSLAVKEITSFVAIVKSDIPKNKTALAKRQKPIAPIARVPIARPPTPRAPTARAPIPRPPIAQSSIASTEEMTDWHAVLISVIWNIHAWRFWVHSNVDDIFNYKMTCKWSTFKRKLTEETEKWSQYNRFSKRLIQVLSERYKTTWSQNKPIKYGDSGECQSDIEEIINMSQRLIQWLTIIINDSSVGERKKNIPDDIKWYQFKNKVKEFLNVWFKYDIRVKLYLNKKYGSLISGYLSKWDEPGPVWVMSACGAVPSGAVAAGTVKDETIWVARTTHKCSLLPAALCPSKHHCTVYSNSKTYYYTKYEVLCNAEAIWEAWRAGTIHPRAVEITSEVYIGRVQFHGSHIIGGVHGPSYRCHVALYNKPFTFNCYELLVNCNVP